jgi:hypothetical protein
VEHRPSAAYTEIDLRESAITPLEDTPMQRLIVLSLAGLLLLPAAWAEDTKAKKNGDEKLFKVDGKLAKDDPVDRVRKDNPHKVHEYRMKAGSIQVITLTSKNPRELDNYLRLEDSAGKSLAEDDDSAGFPNARIIFKAPRDDTYRIIATAYSGVGDYTLTVRQATPTDLQGALGLGFGESLRLQYEARYRAGDKKAGQLLDEAEAVLKQVAAHEPKLAPQVKELQFALAKLTTGRTAMEIVADDLDGKKFKLSDYRGKVVVLDFWGNW